MKILLLLILLSFLPFGCSEQEQFTKVSPSTKFKLANSEHMSELIAILDKREVFYERYEDGMIGIKLENEAEVNTLAREIHRNGVLSKWNTEVVSIRHIVCKNFEADLQSHGVDYSVIERDAEETLFRYTETFGPTVDKLVQECRMKIFRS